MVLTHTWLCQRKYKAMETAVSVREAFPVVFGRDGVYWVQQVRRVSVGSGKPSWSKSHRVELWCGLHAPRIIHTHCLALPTSHKDFKTTECRECRGLTSKKPSVRAPRCVVVQSVVPVS